MADCCDVAVAIGGGARVGVLGTGTCRVTTRPNPKPPGSCQAVRWRRSWASIPALWRTLTTPQRDAWAALAALWPAVDPCGNSVVLSGYQFFTKVNGELNIFGPSYMLSDAPPGYGTPPAYSHYPNLEASRGAPFGVSATVNGAYEFSIPSTTGVALSLTYSLGGDEPDDPPIIRGVWVGPLAAINLSLGTYIFTDFSYHQWVREYPPNTVGTVRGFMRYVDLDTGTVADVQLAYPIDSPYFSGLPIPCPPSD